MKQQPSAEYRGYRTAGIRLTEEWAPELRGTRESTENAALYAYHMFDKAHVVMLAEEGIIPRHIGVALLTALREMEGEGVETARSRVGGGMHSGELYLIRKLGEEIGGWEHLGRSSSDLQAVGQRVQERDRLLETLELANLLRETVLNLAEQHLETVMPAYFMWQHAQPITLAHYLVAMGEALARDAARAQECYARVNRSPAGAVILTGTSFVLRRERTAELLGFDGVHVNTLDAVQDADHALETYGVVAMLAAHLERLGEDLAYWSGTEAGYVDIADRFASASSILMQMKTPTPPSYARSAFASIVGGMMGAYLGAKGSTGMLANLGPLEHSFAEVHRSLRLLTPALASVRVDAPRARRQAGLHFAAGTDLAAALVVERGLPWRSAHQICGILFRLCAERSLTPSDVSPALLDEAAVDYFGRPVGLAAEVIQDALDPLSFVQRRTLLGGPAPAETLRQVEVLNQALERDRRWLDAARDAVKQSAQRLDAAIDALLEG